MAESRSSTGGPAPFVITRNTASRRTEKVSEVIARRIVNDIVAAGLKRGAMLPPESQMLERFKVGRASLREALRILEVHGLITIKSGPGGGPIVADPDSRNFGRMATMYFEMAGATFRDLVEARLILEPMMARTAAIRQNPQVIAGLRGLVDDAGEVLEDPLYGQAASEFHGAISSASGNPILDLMARAIKEVYHERVSGMLFEPDYRRQLQEDHRGVVDAIESGDPEKAEMRMRVHMEEFAQKVAERYPGMLDEVVDWR